MQYGREKQGLFLKIFRGNEKRFITWMMCCREGENNRESDGSLEDSAGKTFQGIHACKRGLPLHWQESQCMTGHFPSDLPPEKDDSRLEWIHTVMGQQK